MRMRLLQAILGGWVILAANASEYRTDTWDDRVPNIAVSIEDSLQYDNVFVNRV